MTKLGAINIFEKYLTDVSIFKDRGVLRHTYTPDYLPHRDKEVNSLASIMVAALRGDAPSNILIYGKTGTGKTAVAKYVGMELERHGEICSIPCYVIYLNCEIVDTQYRLLAHLARHFDKDIPMTGWPTDQVYDEFKKAIDSEQIIVIVMLDEIDKLIRKGDDVLYNLSRINGDLKRSRVSIIGISNDLKFTDYLDPRVKSSLGEEEIIFPPYNAEQIEDILKQRAEMAFEPGVLDETVIPLCAAFAAREHGDARRALDILRISAELAEREKSPVVDERHVRDARYKLEVDRVVEVIRTLPTQSKLVLLSILKMAERGADRFTTGEVYTIYRQMCHEIQMEVLTQRRITDLISELDMLGIVNAMVVSKGRYGRTKEISLSVPHNTTQSVLLEDYRVKPLTSFTVPVATQTKLYI